MKKIFVAFLILSLCVGLHSPVEAKEKLKIAVMHSLTGSLALAGGLAGQRGSLVAIDMWNARGGILDKYGLVPIEAEDQSSPGVAIREVERLINMEKVPVILGIYSSAIATPLAPICDKNKTILWITIAIADAVVKGKNLNYVFRPQPMGSQWGQSSLEFLKDNLSKLGYQSPSDIKMANVIRTACRRIRGLPPRMESTHSVTALRCPPGFAASSRSSTSRSRRSAGTPPVRG